MKKISSYLIALAMTAFTFTSCEDVPAPFGQPVNPVEEIAADPEGTGTQADPYNVAAIIAFTSGLEADTPSKEVYFHGFISQINDIDTNGTYGNATYYITDDKSGKGSQFYIYRGYGLGGQKFNEPNATIIKVGDEVVLKSKVTNYKGTTPETVQNECSIVELNGKKADASGDGGGDDGGDPTPAPTGDNLLVNGDFETWTSGQPDNWKPASTAGGAVLSQSNDAHGGSYSVKVTGASSNKRIAYKEITLKAGTYNIQFFAKGVADGASVRPGWVAIKDDGSADSNNYKYGDYVNDITASEWVEVKHQFTLEAQTKLCLVIMNPKDKGDVLIDDYSLTTANGGLVDEGQGGSDPQPSGTAYFEESFANGQGNFTIENKVFSGVWTAASYQNDKYMMATSYIQATGETKKANHDAENWLISPTFNIASATNPVLTFSQVINAYFGTIADEAMVYAKKEGGNWTKLNITHPTTPTSGFTKFTDAAASTTVSLSDYKSTKTQIAFVYKGTASKAGTWEIKDVKVVEKQ